MENLTLDEVLQLYRDMVRIRTFESTVIYESFPKGVLFGNFHPYIGEEAIAVGACRTIGKADYIVSTHRGHGHCIAKGADTKKMMAELYGKETGYCKGRGGSLHVADVSLGILGSNGIVGAGIPIAAGAALAAHIRKSSQVTLGFFGEGASNEGAFHEAVNMAAIWKLPVVFVCENNQWACGTCYTDVLNTPGVAERAAGYGIVGIRIDGNDVFAVKEAVGEAVQRAREGNGPSIVECLTFRITPHNSSDSDPRPDELLQEWKQKDPINRLAAFLLRNGAAQKTLDDIQKAARDEMDSACAYAEMSAYPNAADVCEYVYTQNNEQGVNR